MCITYFVNEHSKPCFYQQQKKRKSHLSKWSRKCILYICKSQVIHDVIEQYLSNWEIEREREIYLKIFEIFIKIVIVFFSEFNVEIFLVWSVNIFLNREIIAHTKKWSNEQRRKFRKM